MIRILIKILTMGNQKNSTEMVCVWRYSVGPLGKKSPKIRAKQFTKIKREGIQKINNTNNGFFKYMLIFLSSIY